MRFSHFFRFLLFSKIIIFGYACEEKPKPPQSYERIERFETGSISRRVNIVNGEKEGLMTDYYPDGKVLAERWFKNDMQHGRTLIFHASGAVKEVQYYEQGKQYNGDTIWYEDGRVQFTTFFQNDKKQGYLRKWSQDGRLLFEAKYDQDTLIEVNGEPISRHSLDSLTQPKSQ